MHYLKNDVQGDQEQEHQLKVSPLMDRNEATGMTKSQVHLFNCVLRAYMAWLGNQLIEQTCFALVPDGIGLSGSDTAIEGPVEC